MGSLADMAGESNWLLIKASSSPAVDGLRRVLEAVLVSALADSGKPGHIGPAVRQTLILQVMHLSAVVQATERGCENPWLVANKAVPAVAGSSVPPGADHLPELMKQQFVAAMDKAVSASQRRPAQVQYVQPPVQYVQAPTMRQAPSPGNFTQFGYNRGTPPRRSTKQARYDNFIPSPPRSTGIKCWNCKQHGHRAEVCVNPPAAEPLTQDQYAPDKRA